MNSRLECRNLTKDYGNVMALSDVNLTLESGRIVGLLGPNGSGKTTMIKLANGLLQPTSGEILLNGLNRDRRQNHLFLIFRMRIIYRIG